MIWEAIQSAKSEKLNLDIVWLNLAIANKSLPHQMIQLSRRITGVMLDDYFSGFPMRFSTYSYTAIWINLEIGIVMGCNISPILFVMAMEVILKAAEGNVVKTKQRTIKTGKKWKVVEAVDQAKECLKIIEVTRQTQTGRKKLWSSTTKNL